MKIEIRLCVNCGSSCLCVNTGAPSVTFPPHASFVRPLSVCHSAQWSSQKLTRLWSLLVEVQRKPSNTTYTHTRSSSKHAGKHRSHSHTSCQRKKRKEEKGEHLRLLPAHMCSYLQTQITHTPTLGRAETQQLFNPLVAEAWLDKNPPEHTRRPDIRSRRRFEAMFQKEVGFLT